MKRSWNPLIWAGFFLVLAGALSYVPFFALFPVTRDFPWANLTESVVVRAGPEQVLQAFDDLGEKAAPSIGGHRYSSMSIGG